MSKSWNERRKKQVILQLVNRTAKLETSPAKENILHSFMKSTLSCFWCEHIGTELLQDVVFTTCDENVLPKKTLARCVCFNNRFNSRHASDNDWRNTKMLKKVEIDNTGLNSGKIDVLCFLSITLKLIDNYAASLKAYVASRSDYRNKVRSTAISTKICRETLEHVTRQHIRMAHFRAGKCDDVWSSFQT